MNAHFPLKLINIQKLLKIYRRIFMKKAMIIQQF